jgi:MerR family transcriptional regulator/heat shock protein HspR
MDEKQYTRIIIQSSQQTAYYSEQETAEYSRLEVQVIRQLHDAGVIEGITVAGEEPRYSEEEIAVLRRARRLHDELGINLEGVEVILRLQARLEALQRELEHYRKR